MLAILVEKDSPPKLILGAGTKLLWLNSKGIEMPWVVEVSSKCKDTNVQCVLRAPGSALNITLD